MQAILNELQYHQSLIIYTFIFNSHHDYNHLSIITKFWSLQYSIRSQANNFVRVSILLLSQNDGKNKKFCSINLKSLTFIQKSNPFSFVSFENINGTQISMFLINKTQNSNCPCSTNCNDTQKAAIKHESICYTMLSHRFAVLPSQPIRSIQTTIKITTTKIL